MNKRQAAVDTAHEAFLRYHEDSKHRLDAYAPGPLQVDWSSQPDPFRRFEGSAVLPLPLAADRLAARYSDLFRPGAVPMAPLSRETVALLLELSLGLSGWKSLGPDRWPLRCTPSSGNLHPTEAYVLASGIEGLPDGLYHYAADGHALERRATVALAAPGLWIGLSTVHWREAWKYGLRAFRYCQLDTGHAAAAIAMAAAALGWSVARVDEMSHDALAELLGTGRRADFDACEPEEPEMLLQILRAEDRSAQAPRVRSAVFHGAPGACARGARRDWPQIDNVAAATRSHPPARASSPLQALATPRRSGDRRAADVLLNRRSARRFTSRIPFPASCLFDLLGASLPSAAPPVAQLGDLASTHLIIAVHRVDGLEQGLYALRHHPAAAAALPAEMDPGFAWTRVDHAPPHLPLYLLARGNFRPVMRKLACHQGIAAEGAATMIMLSEFAGPVCAAPGRYRSLHWEAGMLGQRLYLEAEAVGIGASGIGCFFDDEIHEFLGISSDVFQALYLFGLGWPLHDPHLVSDPTYAGRQRDEVAHDWQTSPPLSPPA